MPIEIRRAKPEDSWELAKMNQQLIKDEQSRNPMLLDELEARMRSWLLTWMTGVIIMKDNLLAGYCIFQEQADEYFPEQTVIYIRQFFISRHYRREGIGHTAFEMIVNNYFAPGAQIRLDVLAHNSVGREFWSKLGFQPQSVRMERTIAEKL